MMDSVGVLGPLEPYNYNATIFRPQPYVAPRNILRQHRWPRFGFTNNFDVLVDGLDQSIRTNSGLSKQAEEYVTGVVVGALLIFGLALLWFAIIVGFKIAGVEKVGFLAGRFHHPQFYERKSREDAVRDVGTLPVIGEEPEAGDENDSTTSDSQVINEEETEKFKRRVWHVRTIFILCGIGAIVCGILFYSMGIRLFIDSLEYAHRSLDQASSTVTRAMSLTNKLLDEKEQLVTALVDTKKATMGQFCVGDSPIAQHVRSVASDIESQVNELGSFVSSSVQGFEDDLQDVVNIMDEVNDQLSKANGFLYATVAVSIVIFTLIISVLAVTVLSMKGVSNRYTKCATHGIIWPVFIFLLVLAWILGTLFLVTSLTGSDFCVQPDFNILSWLRRNEDIFQSAISHLIVYYVGGCKQFPQDVDAIFRNVTAAANKALGQVNQAQHLLSNFSDENIASVCGYDNAAAIALKHGINIGNSTIYALYGVFGGVCGILECKTISPIYTNLVHDAVCMNAVNGLTWLFSTTTLFALFSTTMFCLRAAMYPVKLPGIKRSSLTEPLLQNNNTDQPKPIRQDTPSIII